MHRFHFLIVALCLGCQAHAFAADPRPNVVLVITDDQGYGDLSCHGNPILKTPNLDRLHAQSVRLVDFMVCPTCAPTRAALMTGRHEFRSGVTHTINERERLALSAVTYAQLLQGAGYATGIFGKWHLGDEAAYRPDQRGFTESFIHGAGGIGQTFPGSCGDAPGNRYFDPAILHNGRFEKTKGYCTDVFFTEALKWIHAQKDAGPFYAHIALNAPHEPLDCPEEYAARYSEPLRAGQVPEKTAKFFGMISNIDDRVGDLLDRLGEWGLERNTLVIFMTDNGGTAGVGLHNAGMRGSKVTPWLGGIRVPSFWRWPGTLAPGDRQQLAAHLDVFPTLLELARVTPPADVAQKLEGRSLVPLLHSAEARWPDRMLITHVGRWPKGQTVAAKYRACSVRSERFQLVSPDGGETAKWQLFDLESDFGQQRDIRQERPEVAREMEVAFDRWWDSVQPDLVNEDAVGPPVNPFKSLYWDQFPEERPRD